MFSFSFFWLSYVHFHNQEMQFKTKKIPDNRIIVKLLKFFEIYVFQKFRIIID
jgi:hypothetical protein